LITWNEIVDAILAENIHEAVLKSYEVNYQINEFTDTSLTPNKVFYILEEKSKDLSISTYLSSKLNYTYSHLSKIFTEANFSSINNYFILRKVDIAKDFIIGGHFTLTEIAYKLNYSSVAHLSSQFKKITGFTPSDFQRIFQKKKNLELNNNNL
jgi:YesN/AraC family two-component response regulator